MKVKKLLRRFFIHDKIILRDRVMDRYAKLILDMFNEHRIPRTFPVNLVGIAKALGYRVCDFNVNKKNEHVSGAVAYSERMILLNPQENPERRRFTLAHEIGHIVLGHESGGNRLDKRNDIMAPAKGSLEWNANEFAAELLMPEVEFKKIWNTFKNDGVLANFFCVSKSAIDVRKQVLGIS